MNAKTLIFLSAMMTVASFQAFAFPIYRDIDCVINDRKYPDEQGRFEFFCAGNHQAFTILCNLSTDPVENGGYNKLAIREGKWITQQNGEFLEFSDGANKGILACDKSRK